MSEISRKLHDSILKSQYSYGELAKLTGIPKSAIQRYATGQTPKIPMDRLQALADVLNVSAQYLLGWEDPKISRIEPVYELAEQTVEEQRLLALWRHSDEYEKNAVFALLNRHADEIEDGELPKRPVVIKRPIPLYGQSFAAGSPETPGDAFTQDYYTDNPKAQFAIHVNGNSMEPYLPDGSVALGVRRPPEDGEVGAFFLDGGFLVKQVCQDSQGNIYLLSLNRERSDADETIWHDAGRDLRWMGTILMKERIPLP